MDKVEWARDVQGLDEEMDVLLTAMFDKVILRLLRPMETAGRKIKPVLCHGDLWHGNVRMDKATGQPILYDATAFYGHSECKLSFL